MHPDPVPSQHAMGFIGVERIEQELNRLDRLALAFFRQGDDRDQETADGIKIAAAVLRQRLLEG
jgi:hypothetical protein